MMTKWDGNIMESMYTALQIFGFQVTLRCDLEETIVTTI